MKALQMLMVTMVAAAVLAFVVPQRFATPASAGGAPTKRYAVVGGTGDGKVAIDTGDGSITLANNKGIETEGLSSCLRHAASQGWAVHSVMQRQGYNGPLYVVVLER
jgi:hypothetical protein